MDTWLSMSMLVSLVLTLRVSAELKSVFVSSLPVGDYNFHSVEAGARLRTKRMARTEAEQSGRLRQT